MIDFHEEKPMVPMNLDLESSEGRQNISSIIKLACIGFILYLINIEFKSESNALQLSIIPNIIFLRCFIKFRSLRFLSNLCMFGIILSILNLTGNLTSFIGLNEYLWFNFIIFSRIVMIMIFLRIMMTIDMQNKNLVLLKIVLIVTLLELVLLIPMVVGFIAMFIFKDFLGSIDWKTAFLGIIGMTVIWFLIDVVIVGLTYYIGNPMAAALRGLSPAITDDSVERL